jgi:hypothetical protein
MSKTLISKLVRWLATLIIILVNVVLLAKPCDLAYNVAQHRHILLGRYTVDRLSTLVLLVPVSVLIIKGIWSNRKRQKGEKEKREELFKAVALSFSIVLSIIIADIFLRVVQQRRYVGNRSYYHRVPNTKEQGINRDVPPTAFSYPIRAPGYADISYTLTVDKRGFRNQTDLEQYDVVTLGDSFTEGSHVSDEHAWPTVFARKSNLAVYNLGMSGGSPVTYLETLKRFGLKLSPKIVVCVLYEGNDFRGSNFARKKVKRQWKLKDIYKTSPLRHSIKRALIRWLGPVNSRRFSKHTGANPVSLKLFEPSHPLYAVSWLPLAVPDGSNANYYAFKVKRLLSHFITKENLQRSVGCQGLFTKLREIKKLCTENNIRFVVMYAPDKPHVLLPLVRDKLTAEKLHAFMALKKKDLPAPGDLMDVLIPRLHVHESVIKEFCSKESIGFVSLTQSLREEILKGSQVYFTYDQHWTPLGQEIAAHTLQRYIGKRPARGRN